MSLRYLLKGQMKYMASKGIEVKMASSDGKEVSEVIAYENCTHKKFPFTRSITPFKDFVALLKLSIWLKREQFDIVHSHTPKAGVLAMLGSYVAGIPIRMYTIAGIPWMEEKGVKRRLLKTVDRLALRFATHIYPNSKVLESFVLSEKLVNPKKVKVLGNGSTNGIDLDYFSSSSVKMSTKELRVELQIPTNNFVFVFVGRIVKDKGMNELHKAFSKLPDSCSLILVGPLEQELDPICPEAYQYFSNAKNVYVMGYQSDVRPFYKMADALVFPSYREGFPNVPLQAGAMDLPSIVTNINGCNEIIEQKENGLIIPPKNAEALFQAMTSLHADSKLLAAMRKKSRKMVSDRYNQDKLHELIYKEYQNALSDVC